MQRIWVLIAVLSSAAVFAANPGGVIFKEDFESGLKPIWKKVEFGEDTAYSIVKEGGNAFLQARSERGASGLAVKLERTPASGATLSWKWKIDRIPPGGSDSDIKKFDHTARLFVAFRTLIGPPRTINYVWANEAKTGSTFHHPNSGRSRFIVLESGNAKAGKWIPEERNIARDWQKLFGDDEPPDIVGLGFMTDSDGTAATVTGWYDDFLLKR